MITYQVNEGSSAKLTGVLKDQAGNLLGSAGVASLTAELYDKNTDTSIFGVKDILNVNGGELDSVGNFAYTFAPSDNAIVTAGVRGYERHILLVEWSYDGGSKAGKQEFEVAVKNLSHVP